MKKIRLLVLLPALLWLGACSTTQQVTSLLGSPAATTAVYDAAASYAATQKLSLKYYQYCFTDRTYAQIQADPVAKGICQKRRTVWRAVQKADGYALKTLTTANSVLNQGAIDAAVAAVKAFTSTVPSVPVS